MTIKMNKVTIERKENSWYLKTGLTHHFMCECGHVDQCTDNMLLNIHHPKHSCSHCGNSYYLDSVMFLNNPKVIMWLRFNWNIQKKTTEESWIIRAYSSIPVFNYALQKIEFKKIVIATNTLFYTGKHEYREVNHMILKKNVYNNKKRATLIKETIAQELKETLYSYALSSSSEKTAWIEYKKYYSLSAKEGIKLLSFFLKHDHLKEVDFYYWDDFEMFVDASKQYPSVKEMLSYISNHRKEKSLKKAYFESYERSMEIHSHYNCKTDYIFARHIEDRNFLLKLIQMDPEVKHILFDEIFIGVLEEFFEFLTEHYTEKSITVLFTKLHVDAFRYNNIVRDTLWMFQGEAQNFIREHFRKVSLNFGDLHYEFIRITTMRKTALREKIKFEYHKNQLKAQVEKEQLVYCLPETTNILHMWSQTLHNCMYGYARAIHQGDTLIYGVFKDKELTYAIEIRRNKIAQAFGKYNRHIEDIDREKIDTWYQDVYIAGWMSVA